MGSSVSGSSASIPTASRASSPRTRSCRPATRLPATRSSDWQRFSQTVEDFAVGFIVELAAVTRSRATRSPPRTTRRSPTTRTRPGARQFPMLVPTAPDDPASAANRKAWETLRAWTKPFLTAFSDQDPITRGGDRAFQREVPGCAGPTAHDDRRRRPLPAGGQGRRARPRRRRLDRRRRRVTDDQPLDVFALLDEVQAIARSGLHYSENPFDRERYTRLLDAALREYAARTPLDDADGPRALRRRDRLRHREGRRRRRGVRRRTTASCSCTAPTTASGASSRAGSTRTSRPSRPSCASSPRKPACRARVDALVGVFFREARAGEHPHGTVSVVYLCSITGGTPTPQLHEVTEVAWRAIDDVARRRMAPPPRTTRPRRARRALAPRAPGSSRSRQSQPPAARSLVDVDRARAPTPARASCAAVRRSTKCSRTPRTCVGRGVAQGLQPERR